MSKVDKGEYAFNDTLRADDIKDGDLKVVQEMKEVGTKYGEKRIMMFDDDTQLFLNSMSLQNLVTDFGDETDAWVGKQVKLTLETSERTRGKNSIIVESAVKEEKV